MAAVGRALRADALGIKGLVQEACKEALPRMVYPAPRIKWFPYVAEHPSIFDGVSPLGLQRPDFLFKPEPCETDTSPPQTPPTTAATSSQPSSSRPSSASGRLLISVVGAADLLPPTSASSSERYYRVSAYYHGEPAEAAGPRKTRPVKATGRPDRAEREACAVYQQIRLPMRRAAQILKVVLYLHSADGDLCVGEATVPIADPRATFLTGWPVDAPNTPGPDPSARDLAPRGTLVMQVLLPGHKADDALRAPLAGDSTPLPPLTGLSQPLEHSWQLVRRVPSTGLPTAAAQEAQVDGGDGPAACGGTAAVEGGMSGGSPARGRRGGMAAILRNFAPVCLVPRAGAGDEAAG